MADDDTDLLPLDAWHRAQGARMVPFAGYAMPIQYDGIVAEHLWTRAHAGLFDVSHMGQLMISGDDAATALETVLPSDICGLARGRTRYSLLLDEDAGILDDLMVSNTPMGYYLVVNGATKWDDIAHLREQLPDTITINHLDHAALLALQGPEATVALARVIPGVAALSFMDCAAFVFEGEPLWISRSGYTGEDGFEISVPAAHVGALADALLAQDEVRPVGLGARDSLRLEAGLPLYGHDLTPDRPDFFRVCETLDEIGPDRPFYPARGMAGMNRLSHAQALGFADAGGLMRLCDRATAERPSGAPLFWTLGANQTGKAAIAAWRDMLLPALARGDGSLRLWPFEGPFRGLLAPGVVALAETYPAEAWRHLGIAVRGSKRQRTVRAAAGPALLDTMVRLRAMPEPALIETIADGFGNDAAGEDRFDSLLGALCVLNVLAGHRPDTAPDDPWVTAWEGWVLGQTAVPV